MTNIYEVVVEYKGETYRGRGYSRKQAKLRAFLDYIRGKKLPFSKVNKLRKDFMKKGKVVASMIM